MAPKGIILLNFLNYLKNNMKITINYYLSVLTNPFSFNCLQRAVKYEGSCINSLWFSHEIKSICIFYKAAKAELSLKALVFLQFWHLILEFDSDVFTAHNLRQWPFWKCISSAVCLLHWRLVHLGYFPPLAFFDPKQSSCNYYANIRPMFKNLTGRECSLG